MGMLFNHVRCRFAHRSKEVILGYSNRTHRWRCKTCGHEWDD